MEQFSEEALLFVPVALALCQLQLLSKQHYLVFKIFKIHSLRNSKSYVADILRECSPPTTCHKSPVTCIFFFIFLILFFDKV